MEYCRDFEKKNLGREDAEAGGRFLQRWQGVLEWVRKTNGSRGQPDEARGGISRRKEFSMAGGIGERSGGGKSRLLAPVRSEVPLDLI